MQISFSLNGEDYSDCITCHVVTLYSYFIVPFLYELRNVMDWVWTDTALSLYHWMEVEDIFAKVFVLKCWRRSELEYPTARGTNRWYVVKYAVGGLLMIFFFLCFWGPLVLGSVIGTIFVRNPPFRCQFKMEMEGFSVSLLYYILYIS